MKKHILKDCKTVPDVRQHWLGVFSSKQASSTAGEQAVLSGVKRKAQHQQDIRRHLASRDWDLTESERESVSYDLLRFAITSNLGFKQFNNVHLHAALAKLRPQYSVPSPTAFTVLLDREYLGVMEKLRVKISNSQNLTLSLDGWTDACKRSILAFVLLFPDRTQFLAQQQQVLQQVLQQQQQLLQQQLLQQQGMLPVMTPLAQTVLQQQQQLARLQQQNQ